VQIFRIARRQGKIIRSATDCLIAAIALKHNLTVLHDDRDYAVTASFSGLRERRVADFIS
jgi:predicted nucleic acid-binding protein